MKQLKTKYRSSVATQAFVAFAIAITVGNSPSLAGTTSIPTLSGMNTYGTLSDGAYTNLDWNTVGGDYNYNLYVSSGGQSGAFLNSGDSQATTPISLALTPGIYTYTLFADGGYDGDGIRYFGLNLCFDGSVKPSISVYAPQDETTLPTAFSPDSQSTPILGPASSATQMLTPGSGTLSFTDGSEQISVTDFSWSDYTVYGVDRVSQQNLGANGLTDYIGTVTLQVSSVPEPASLSLLALTGAALLGRRRSSR